MRVLLICLTDCLFSNNKQCFIVVDVAFVDAVIVLVDAWLLCSLLLCTPPITLRSLF